MTEDQITTLLMCARVAVNTNAITEVQYSDLSDALWSALEDDEEATFDMIADMHSDRLIKELSFARGFAPYPDDERSQEWLEALEAEAKIRGLEA